MFVMNFRTIRRFRCCIFNARNATEKVINVVFLLLFSYTFELIQEDSDKVWKFQRYDLVQEYHNRPMFSPPLILIGHLFIFIRWIWQLCRCGNPPQGSSMSKYARSTNRRNGILAPLIHKPLHNNVLIN